MKENTPIEDVTHTLTSVAVSALFMHNGFSKGSFNNYMDTWQLAIRENIHNMSQGPPNPGFMQEKVQKGDFLKKDSRELKFFSCFRFL